MIPSQIKLTSLTSRVQSVEIDVILLLKCHIIHYFLIICINCHIFYLDSLFYSKKREIVLSSYYSIYLFTSEINPVSTSYTAPEITTSSGIKGDAFKAPYPRGHSPQYLEREENRDLLHPHPVLS